MQESTVSNPKFRFMTVHFSVNKVILLVLKMFTFVPNKAYLRGILLHYFIQNKYAAEAHRILVETCGDDALSSTTRRDWFRRFKNYDFKFEVKNVLTHRTNLKTKNWGKYSMKTDLKC